MFFFVFVLEFCKFCSCVLVSFLGVCLGYMCFNILFMFSSAHRYAISSGKKVKRVEFGWFGDWLRLQALSLTFEDASVGGCLPCLRKGFLKVLLNFVFVGGLKTQHKKK